MANSLCLGNAKQCRYKHDKISSMRENIAANDKFLELHDSWNESLPIMYVTDLLIGIES